MGRRMEEGGKGGVVKERDDDNLVGWASGI